MSNQPKMGDSVIKELELNNEQVKKIVLEWYTNGMYTYNIKNEAGQDLEEIMWDEIAWGD